MPVQSYCALRKRRSVIMEILGSAWRGQAVEHSPQSWQTHGSRPPSRGTLSPSSAKRMLRRGKLAVSLTRSQESVQLPH